VRGIFQAAFDRSHRFYFILLSRAPRAYLLIRSALSHDSSRYRYAVTITQMAVLMMAKKRKRKGKRDKGKGKIQIPRNRSEEDAWSASILTNRMLLRSRKLHERTSRTLSCSSISPVVSAVSAVSAVSGRCRLRNSRSARHIHLRGKIWPSGVML